MAPAATPEDGLDSLPGSTPSDLLGEIRIPRHFFRIPSDQRDLLEQSDSWAERLQQKPQPGLNVPLQVLEQLRNFHRLQHELPEASSPGPHTNQVLQDIVQHDENEPRASQEERPEPSENQDAEETAGTPIPWESSPVQHQMPPQDQRFLSQSPAPEDFADQLPSSPTNNHSFISQVSAGSPLQPTYDAAHLLKKPPAFKDFPPSSQELEEEELEVVPPGALGVPVQMIERILELDPTPPSAQVEVPSTFEPQGPLPEMTGNKQPKHSNYAALQQVQKRVALQKTNITNTTATTQRMLSHNRQMNSSTGILDTQSSMESVIPATNVHRLERSPEKSTVKGKPLLVRQPRQPPQLDILCAPVRSSPPATIDGTIRHQSPEYTPISPQMSITLPQAGYSPKAEQITSHVTDAPRIELEPQAPFIRYSVAYPDYNGHVEDFVRACVYIELLHQRQALASYQYDDFIRAWHEGFLPYIQCLSQDDKILGAREWYMETVDDLKFCKKIIHKDNLRATLEFYGDEARKARKLIVPIRRKSSAAIQPGHILGQEAELRTSQPADKRIHSGDSEVIESLGKPITSTSEEPTRLQVADSRLDEHASSSSSVRSMLLEAEAEEEAEAEAQRVPSQDSMGHISPTTVTSRSSRKRHSDEDFQKPAQKRRSHGTLSPSKESLVSAQSLTTPDSLQEPLAKVHKTSVIYLSQQRTDEDSKMRKLARFKRHVKEGKEQRRMRENSIASSAPISTTPRSGQKSVRDFR